MKRKTQLDQGGLDVPRGNQTVWFGDRVVCLASNVSEEPTTLKEALTVPEAEESHGQESIKSNEVWTLTDLPQGSGKQVGLQTENRDSHTV